jgi:hypothetical protein
VKADAELVRQFPGNVATMSRVAVDDHMDLVHV